MSLFSWLSPKKKPRPAAAPESSGLSRMESTKPYNARHGVEGVAHAQPANRKSERMARRELLYGVVRESMVRAGVLSGSYKFKVLSLDARGRQFLVMVDLASEAGVEPMRLAEVEAMIAQGAKARYDILVSAVYWRMNDHVAVGQVQPKTAPRAAGPQPVAPAAEDEAANEPTSQPIPLEAPSGRFDPLHPEEVAAFKRALAKGASGADAMAEAAVAAGLPARSFDGKAKHGPQSYTLLTGFEDTEMADPDAPPGTLSATQYGDLR